MRKPRTARYSHIAFNDISCVHCAPGFEIATHRVLPTLLSAVHLSIPFLPPNAFLSLASPPFHSSLSPSRFISPCSPLPVSTRTLTPPPPPPPPVAKQIAKYPQVVDFRERLCVANSISTPRRVKTNTDKAEWSANGVCAEVNSRDFDGSLG